MNSQGMQLNNKLKCNINVTAMHLVLKHYADTLTKGYILTVASVASFIFSA